MRRCRQVTTIGLLAVLTSSYVAYATDGGAASKSMVSSELGAKINEYVERLTAFGFSGALLVAKDDDVVLAKGYGLANREKGVPCRPETVFTIGSITKQFTGAAVVKLEMQGKLGVNDPITKFFDNVPEDKAEITIHHLLTHTAGLVDGLGDDFDLQATRDWVLRQAMKSRLKWKPGTRHRYSNLGYSLLGMIVEKASGRPYEKFLREHLFKPAGMTRTGYLLPRFRPDELATGYSEGEPWGTVLGHPMLDDGPCWNLRGNGGIHSTVLDMYKWHRALEGNEILSEEAKKKYFAPHVDEGYGDSFYGYGWVNFKTARGTRLLAHNGGNMIFSADFRRYVDEGVMFFLASNVSGFFVDPISSQIARVIFGHPYDLPPKTIELDQTSLARYGGTYRLPSRGQIAVTVHDGRLAFAPQGQNALSLFSPGRRVPAERLEELNKRTATIIELSALGDYTTLHEAFGGRISAGEIAEMARKEWEDRRSRMGPFKGVEVLGSAPYRMEMLATTVRLDFERGSEFVRFGWGHGSLTGYRACAGPPTDRFVPQSSTDFVSFKPGPHDVVRAVFKILADGTVTAFTVNTHGDEVTAKKVQ